MSEQENIPKVEQEQKKSEPQSTEEPKKSEPLATEETKKSEDIKISPDIYQDIISLKEKNIFIFTESFEEKIPEILSYLMEKGEEYTLENKIQILFYLQDLFKKVEFYTEIFSKKKSLKEKMSIFEIIINQYITNTSKDYLFELKNIFILLLNKITFCKKTYKYIFSFLVEYLNNKSENKLNSEQVSKILELLTIYYTTLPQIKEVNDYFYCNNYTDYLIKIQNKGNASKKKINFDDSLNILLFIKLIPKEIIKAAESEHMTNLLELDFIDKTKNINFNIDSENNLIMNNNATDKITKLEENKYINILFRFNLNVKENFKIEIFINNKPINFKNSQLEIKEKDSDKNKIKDKYEINSINLFKNFFGQCSNIIIFKNKKIEGLPKFLTAKKVKEADKSGANTISALFDISKKEKIEEIVINDLFVKGLYNEDLLNILIKNELKEKVEQSNIDNIFKNKTQDKIPLTDIEEFFDKIISVYIPSRNELINSEIVLKDSISGLDAVFNIKNKNSDLNGIHLYKSLIEDFNYMGGLNHFIPIIELMVNDTNILTNENFVNFFKMINTLINPFYTRILKDEKNSHFFSNLSLFFKKIPDNFFNSEIVGNIIALSNKFLEQIKDENIIELNRDFQNYILLEEKLLYKCNKEDQNKIIDQIVNVLNIFIKNKRDFVDIGLLKIANIMLYYDKEHLTKFCCKAHSEYFIDTNKEKKIMEPELCDVFKNFEYIIKLICSKFKERSENNIKTQYVKKTSDDMINFFEILTMEVSPCFQKVIIKIFNDFFEENYYNANKYLNILNEIYDISLFVLKSSLFDNKIDIINFINLLFRIKYDLNQKKGAKDKELLPSIKINGAYETLMNNNILTFYLLPKEELNNIDKNKIVKSFYHIGGVEYNYISISETEKKISEIYNKKKLGQLFIDLYDSVFLAFKLHPTMTINLDFLIKLGTKGDLDLVKKFLQDLNKEKNNIIEIKKNSSILTYVLETYFHVFMLKGTNYDKNKFVSRFYYLNEDQNKMKKTVEEICILCRDLINDILKINIYRLDYFLTWGKYYYEISKNKSKITTELIEEFIFNIFSDVDKVIFNKDLIVYTNPGQTMEFLYFINIVFEFISYFKLNIISNENNDRKINFINDKNIKEILFSSFDILLPNIKEPSQKIISNKNKWKYYPLIKKVLQHFCPLWDIIMMKNEDDIDKYLDNKKNINIYVIEFEVLFEEVKDANFVAPEFEKQNTTNRGIKLIYLLYHFFIQLYNLGGDKDDIKEILTLFRRFLTLIIISSFTLSPSTDKRKTKKWNKGEDYKNVQNNVKNIFYHTFLFLYESIKKCDLNISNDSANKNHYLFLKNYLYETLAYLLKVTNTIYRKARRDEDKNANLKGVKGLLNKVKNLKNLIVETEGVKTSGIYSLYEKMYSILNLDYDFEVKNYLDKIPQTDFSNITEKPINSKITECINSFMEEAKNKKLFGVGSSINSEVEYDKIKFYPPFEYIKKRNLSLNFFIPLYDVLPNVEFDENDEKNYVLKKLILTCDYFQKCNLEKDLEKNMQKINENVNKKLLFNSIQRDIERKTNSNMYIKTKKKLFSFLGVWSNEEYFYNKSKYEIKYKLVNHLTSDYTKVLLEPIINIDYYFPEFTKYNYGQIFRNDESINTICNLTDLSFAVPEHKKPIIDEDDDKKIKTEEKKDEEKKDEEKSETQDKKTDEEKKESTEDYNELYDVKLNYYKNLGNNVLNQKDISLSSIPEELIKEFIIQKYSTNIITQYDTSAEACLINSAIHITGLIFNDETGIGFYGYEKVHSKDIYEENYDKERFTCFGSIFRPQNKKYENYFIKIPYNSIELILKRRYFYKRNAIEIFTVDKKSYFFNINDNKFKSLYENIKHYMPSGIEDIIIEKNRFEKSGEKIGFYSKNTFLQFNKSIIPFQNIQKDMSLKTIYENWSKWKISSFKLLMYLNLYSSRTFHDLNQYPVFPWIITDYKSDKLPSLNNEENGIIRQFELPMGMMEITPEAADRKRSYLETWNTEKEDNEPEEESNTERYRSHYSTSLYATYYLVRVFPFSYIRVELQGKNFDDPNRLFNSMKSSFNNSISQKSDLRELIPEFFYFPEMFYNSNKLNLGMVTTSEGEKPCNDVLMPNWANGDGYLFISKHKELLESPVISDNINNWIELIFGIKQKGETAKKIHNLFAKESYEEYEENYKKSNNDEKTLLCKFTEFGVTPSQLFKSVFNKRMAYSELKSNKFLLPNTTEYLKYKENEKELEKIKEFIVEEAKYQIYGIPSKICYTEESKGKYRISALTPECIKIHKRKTNEIHIKKSVALAPNPQTPPSGPNPTPEKEEEKIIIEIDIEQKKEIKLTSSRNRITNPPSVFYNNGKSIALGGYWNGTILAQNIDENFDEKKSKNKNTVMLYTGVNSPVVKIAIDKNETYAVCGNKLGNIFIFIINQNNKLEWTLYKKIIEHRAEITCLDINEELNICISCSKDGYWFTHSLPDCALINSFLFTENIFNKESKSDDKIYYPKIALISYSPLPCAILYFEERDSLCVFAINGKLLKEQKMGFKLKENNIKKYKDMQFNEYLLIFNESKQCIEIYNIIDLNPISSFPSIEHTFVDFITAKELDHILVLAQFKSKNEEKNTGEISAKTAYKIMVVRNNNLEINWK